MALDQFFLFMSLPLEIRRYIYLLATPPRIVQIREKTEKQDDFNWRLKNSQNQIRLDPSLAYFAFNWRTQFPSFGFNLYKFKPPNQPWKPSRATPSISLSYIATRPEYAWELIRKGALYSRAPIPGLLHAFSESRAQLLSCGYELAFRTRTAGPMTWFCFDRDTLYIEKSYPPPLMLSGGLWNVGQFHPGDLQRIKKLALNRSKKAQYSPRYDSLYAFPAAADSHPDTYTTCKEISKLLRLMPCISELFLVELTDDTLGTAKDDLLSSTPVKTSRQPWQLVEMEEIDPMFAVLYSGLRDRLWTTGYNAENLRTHKEHNVDGIPFLEWFESQQQQILARTMEHVISKKDLDEISISSWSIPTIKVVHILSSSSCVQLFSARKSAWQALCKLKAQFKASSTHVPAWSTPSMKVANRPSTATPPDLPVVAFTAGENIAMFGAEVSRRERERERQRTWFIEKGSILEPKNTIL